MIKSLIQLLQISKRSKYVAVHVWCVHALGPVASAGGLRARRPQEASASHVYTLHISTTTHTILP